MKNEKGHNMLKPLSYEKGRRLFINKIVDNPGDSYLLKIHYWTTQGRLLIIDILLDICRILACSKKCIIYKESKNRENLIMDKPRDGYLLSYIKLKYFKGYHIAELIEISNINF
ncbi:hypothetical protein FDN13_05945 [Caloramator sp. E03]|uniref:hypothetical protein n=1 Tax=Caloramator sp. E03 TaxID=2576307 RepID=UPI001110982A|nr:hypothetical protein [Caloramator sp. E03]QCX33281.1 hypothetical protein FDN13_05945 [Caloramator sp. E03]